MTVWAESSIGSDDDCRRLVAAIKRRSQATKWLLMVALAVALFAGIGAIWFTVKRDGTIPPVATPTPPLALSEKNLVDARAAFNRGLAEYTNKDYDKAIADFNETMQLDPNTLRLTTCVGWPSTITKRTMTKR
jgi:tetratricopeptide (TPR) repeat protein